MQLWSVHPEYLDDKTLLDCWKDGLLARRLLLENLSVTNHHPTLKKFKSAAKDVSLIDNYLTFIYKEGLRRNFLFDKSRINIVAKMFTLTVSVNEIKREFDFLKELLRHRNPEHYKTLLKTNNIKTHPIFTIYTEPKDTTIEETIIPIV